MKINQQLGRNLSSSTTMYKKFSKMNYDIVWLYIRNIRKKLTIISHSDIKNVLCTPYHYEKDPVSGEKIKVIEPYLESYFDISSAEVRACGGASQDKNMATLFAEGKDVYIDNCVY